MVFITCLEKSSGFDSIVVVVCYLTKMAHFIPTRTTVDAVETAKLIFCLHGFPNAIFIDRDPKFTSKLTSQDTTSI